MAAYKGVEAVTEENLRRRSQVSLSNAALRNQLDLFGCVVWSSLSINIMDIYYSTPWHSCRTAGEFRERNKRLIQWPWHNDPNRCHPPLCSLFFITSVCFLNLEMILILSLVFVTPCNQYIWWYESQSLKPKKKNKGESAQHFPPESPLRVPVKKINRLNKSLFLKDWCINHWCSFKGKSDFCWSLIQQVNLGINTPVWSFSAGWMLRGLCFLTSLSS